MTPLFRSLGVAAFVLALFVSIAPVAHAQTYSTGSGTTYQNSPIATPPLNTSGLTGNQTPIVNGSGSQYNAAGGTYGGGVIPTAPFDPSSLTPVVPSIGPDGTVTYPNTTAAKTPTSNLNGGAVSATGDTIDYVMSVVMSAFAWLLGIAAITLDNAMYYTVVHMGSYVNNLSAVGVAWRILRDIGNIVLIFGFVALGIEVILDVNFYGGGTKMLPTLVIVAILLNFSLFAAEAVVDVGNLFATEFYTQINNGQAAAPQSYSGTNITTNGISNAVMNQLGLQTIYGAAVNNKVNSDGTTNNLGIFKQGSPFIVGFMAILLFLIAAFVFFSLAFVLITRFVVLIFLIIVAPIGFAGLAVPKLDGTAREWWGTLFAQTITAPAMLLMLYVALAVITDAQFLTGFNVAGAGGAASNAAQSSWTTWLTTGNSGVAGLASIMLSFLVAMGLLLAVTMLAKRMGAIGGQWATNIGGKATFGVAGFAARNTLGRTSNLVGRGIRRVAPNEFGRYASKIFDRGAKASFDFRATGALKTAQNYDGGKAQKGGYLEEVDARKKRQIAFGKTLSSEDYKEYTKLKEEHDAAKEVKNDANKDFNKAERNKLKAEAAQKQAAEELAALEARVDPNNYDDILEQKITAKRAENTTATAALASATSEHQVARTEKQAADATFEIVKSALDKAPKNEQQQYGQSLKSVGNTGLSSLAGGVTSLGTGAATGAALGSLAGPIGTAIGAAAGAALTGALTLPKIARSSASYQAGSALDKQAKLSGKDKILADLGDALKEETKVEKEKAKKEEKKEDAAEH